MKSNVLRVTLAAFALVCVLALFLSSPEDEAASKEAKGDFVSQLVEGTSTESLSLVDLYPEDKTLGRHKTVEELYDQQVKEYNRMHVDYLLQEKATVANKKTLSKVIGVPSKAIKQLAKVAKGKSNAIKLSAKQIKASLGEVKDVKRLVTNCMALKVFAQVNADTLVEKSEKVLGVIKPILTALTPHGNCLEQYANSIKKLMKDKTNMVKGKRMDSVKTHMLRMITKNMQKKGGILVWEARSRSKKNGLFIFLSAKKLGLSGKPHYLRALACSTTDARMKAEALGAAGVIEKINVATGYKPWWNAANTKKAAKVLFTTRCHGAESLSCGKYHGSKKNCMAVGCQWRAKWSGKEANAVADSTAMQTGLKAKAAKSAPTDLFQAYMDYNVDY